jgi:hypothetical protein
MDKLQEITIENLEETFINWEKEFQKKHPILYKIDLLFKNKSIADYRASYSLSHPWIIIEYVFRQVKYAYQRVVRGWDDRAIWSIDYYLAKLIPELLKALKKSMPGIPLMAFSDEALKRSDNPTGKDVDAAQKKYFQVIDEIIAGFENYYNQDVSLDKDELIIHKTLDLFRDWFQTFWS